MPVSDRYPPFRFSHTTRVGFDETDAQGVVYYGRYMPYFDRARTEYLRHLGLLAGTTSAPHQFVMRANRVEYLAPARFDDELKLFVRVSRIGTSSVEFAFAVRDHDAVLLATAEQTLVLIDFASRRPVRIGQQYRSAISIFERAGPIDAATPDRGVGARDAVERIVERESDADAILRAVVAEIARRYDAFCGLRFVEAGSLTAGPSAGEPAGSEHVVPVHYQDALVAELVLRAAPDAGPDAALRDIAQRIAPFCLVGWDTAGTPWQA